MKQSGTLGTFAGVFTPSVLTILGIILFLRLGYVAGSAGLGNLNIKAPTVSMFFLISYGLLNNATCYEASSSSPSFRPKFKWYDSKVIIDE